jgi:hypothetical protein
MQERYLGPVKLDMDVCDVTGKKVGTIAHIYRAGETLATAGAWTTPAPPGAVPAADPVPPTDDVDVMEVKTGFLGLGSHLYIPLNAVQETLNDCVFVSKPQEAFEELGWHHKPAHFEHPQ